MFVMYFPFVIAAGKLYKAIPPLYSVPEGKNKRKYFVDQMDIIKYNQKVFAQKHTIGINKSKNLSTKDLSILFMKNNDYIYFLEKAANTYALDPNLLQIILYHYMSNKKSFKAEKLNKEVNSAYRFMQAKNQKNVVIVSGTIDKYNIAILNDKFINDCREIIEILESNVELYYILDGKKSTLYSIMKVYDATLPNGLQRYKGLGEMPYEQLGESTVLPENRTLIRYTLEDAKALLHDIREYESDTKKILKEIKKIDRSDLTE